MNRLKAHAQEQSKNGRKPYAQTVREKQTPVRRGNVFDVAVTTATNSDRSRGTPPAGYIFTGIFRGEAVHLPRGDEPHVCLRSLFFGARSPLSPLSDILVHVATM